MKMVGSTLVTLGALNRLDRVMVKAFDRTNE